MYRTEKKLTQKELGKLSGIHEVQIRKYERDEVKPKIDNVQKIAVALGVDLYQLVTMDTFPEERGKENLKTQPPFIQYLHTIGYSFEYSKKSDDTELVPSSIRRLPTLQKNDERTVFTDEEFNQFKKKIQESIEYLIWQQNQENKKTT